MKISRRVLVFTTAVSAMSALSLSFGVAAFAAGSEDAPPTTSNGPAATAPANPDSKQAPTTKVSAASLYEDGKEAVDRKDWKAAIALFTEAAKLEPKNADIHNLLGYSYRKSGDYKNAFKHYAEALKLNPKHKGALEYQGEAYAETGDITKAKANLAKLKTVCGNTKCEEYVDLAAAIKTAEAKKAKKK
jgi:tetratricopeptide (TPR) repeat protein